MDAKMQVRMFLSKAEELEVSKYIMADKRISEMLKVIAGSELLYQLFDFCTKDFDYEKAKQNAFVGAGIGKSGKFIRPESDNDFLALVFLMFYEFDTKSMDLVKMLYAYFPSGTNLADSYNVFVKELVIPFRETVKKVTSKMLGEPEENYLVDVQNQKRQVEKLFSNDMGFQETMRLISEDKIAIFNFKMSDTTKADFMCFIDTLETAVFNGEREMAVFAFKAYKYAIKNYKKLPTSVKKIEELFKLYGIL